MTHPSPAVVSGVAVSRVSFSSTAWRMKAGRPYLPAMTSIFANASADRRTGTGFMCSGFRPIGEGLA